MGIVKLKYMVLIINKEKSVNWRTDMSRLKKIIEESLINRKLLEADEEAPVEDEEPEEENFDALDAAIEEMVGITEIQHTTSSSILDFEDGGQIMYVQPMVSLQSETLNKIIDLIITDVEKTYSNQKDEITGKELGKTKYWKSIKTLVSTMVRSQLTKSDNVDGLIDEIKQVFKVLEVK